MTPFDIWAPVLRAPFSGDVTQAISPRFLSDDIAGVPEIEEKIVTEVASYGTQLGKILEALQTLSRATGTPLPEIDTLQQKVTAAKADSREAIRAEAERAMARLRAVDTEAWQRLRE
ncbi:hypothetical protein ACX9MO_02350 [Pseudooceanicola sp. 502str34]